MSGDDMNGATVMARARALAQISDDAAPKLTRLYLSPAHRRAADLVMGWMQDAGMRARIDPLGTVVGRYDGPAADAPALVIGSHIDTVRDAGWYDGNLGVILAIMAVEKLSRAGQSLPFAIEVLAFGDEENLRFPSNLLTARAVAGTAVADDLTRADQSGQTIAQALTAFGLNPDDWAKAARPARDFLAYAEVHIEQGPVLDNASLALGIVTAINGATRWRVTLTGMAGHSGTVPMDVRRDALAGAAQMILAAENTARDQAGLVATVGQITALPGAANVIAGRAQFTLDLRHSDDAVRRRALQNLHDEFDDIATARGLGLTIEPFYDADAATCDPRLVAAWQRTLDRLGHPQKHLPSGAGHDGLAMIARWPISMLFVRCDKGISHNPAESITADDAGAALTALSDFIENFDAGEFA